MKTIIKIFAVAALSLTACGDNIKVKSDGSTIDTGSGNNFPPAPTVGSQIDRMGRPTINTALNEEFSLNGSAALASKDAYNHDESVGTWTSTWTQVLIATLPLLDALDTGVCGNGVCETTVALETPLTCTADCGSNVGSAINVGLDGCGNQAFYDATKTDIRAYGPLAFVLADDELYLETSKSTCAGYLAVEFFTQVLQLSVSSTCGGRAPSYDVIDTTYTLASLGVNGFDKTTFAPAFGDKVGPHTDISDTTFPFLGPPHNN